MSAYKTRGYSINDFAEWDKRGELVLQPRFQRRDVWSSKAKSHLVDTVLRGLPIPIIFIRQNIDPKRRHATREVVDGQQRLNSVLTFLADGFPVLKSQNEAFGGCTFSELPIDMQTQFLNYEFTVVVLEGATDPEVLDVFARFNTYSLRLKPQELLNAEFYGEFKTTMYTLGYEHLQFWRDNSILTDGNIIRMEEADLTSELVIAMLGGIQKRNNKVIEEYYERYDDSFPQKKRISREFKATIDLIAECFDGSLGTSIFRGKPLFYSLFCAFYHLRYEIPKTPELGEGKLLKNPSRSGIRALKNSLDELESRVHKEPTSSNLKPFVESIRKSTTDRDRRVTRTKVIYDSVRDGLSL